MAERPDGAAVSAFFRRSEVWAGFAVASLIGSLAGLHHYFPVVPYIRPDLATIPIIPGSEWVRFRLSFPMLGFFYLVHLDVAFSLWFFNLFSLAVRVLLSVYNVRVTENVGVYGSPSAIFAHLGMGAMAVLVIAGAWTGRHHMARVVRKAFRGAEDVNDSDEILSYRTAVLATFGGLAVMTVWLHAMGIPVWAMVIFLGAAFLLFIGLTRIVAESGMAEAVASTIGSSFVVSSFGTHAIGPRGLVALALTYVWSADIRTFTMASAANGLKIVEHARPKRRVFWALVAAVGVCFVASTTTMLYLGYRHGGIYGNEWFFGGGAKAPYNYVLSKLLYPEGPNWLGWFYTSVGAAVMAALMFLRTRFLWLPLHPVGFAIGPVWIMDQIWMTVFIAWAIKLGILRLGGVRLYQSAPILPGLILGQFVCNGTWIVVDLITGARGNSIFWI